VFFSLLYLPSSPRIAKRSPHTRDTDVYFDIEKRDKRKKIKYGIFKKVAGRGMKENVEKSKRFEQEPHRSLLGDPQS
jgi:hypothetical protein